MEISRCSSSSSISLWRPRTSETCGSDPQRPRQLKSNNITRRESKLDILQRSSISYILDSFRSSRATASQEKSIMVPVIVGSLQDPSQRDWTATKPGIRDTREEGREGSWARNARARTTHCIAMSHLHSDMAGRQGKVSRGGRRLICRGCVYTVDDLSST